MTITQKQQLKVKILEDIKSLGNEIKILQTKVQPIAPDCSLGDLIREEHIIAQDIDKKTLYHSAQRLDKLQFSLSQIDKEDYGVCEECDDEILFERLLILPESRFCVDCLNERD